MATMATPHKSISIHDYPEHLNPFHEEDNHNKIRFWTLGRKLNRSNSISFSGIKDLKNSWAFRSFMKKGKKGNSSQDKSSGQVNGDPSPIVYRRAIQYSSNGSGTRSTVGSPENTGRYVYGGSITPLPRSRFQERLRSSSQYDTNSLSATPRMARSEVSGSRLSMESTNPFDEDPVPPVRAARRKKKRAAPLPPTAGVADVSISSETSELQITEVGDKDRSNTDGDIDIDDLHMNIELKIVEDEDVKNKNVAEPANVEVATNSSQEHINITNEVIEVKDKTPHETSVTTESPLKTSGSADDVINQVPFPKVDIVKYRRNSSVNEDDIRLRRGNLEDFYTLSNKRSKSLNNTSDTTFMAYDINLNEKIANNDVNGNEEPQKFVCKVFDETARKQSISSTEKEFMEIDKATRELEREISKLNSALSEEDPPYMEDRLSVSEIKKRFDKNDRSSPNPIPKPRRSHYGGSSTP